MIRKCQICKKRIAHHVHHIDGNHKNSKPENQQLVCTLCHAKIHGIEPNISELRKLTDYYKKAQKIRISTEHYLRSYNRLELIPPKVTIEMLTQSKQLEKICKKEIIKYFKIKENQIPIYKWLISIKDISNILAAQLLANIDIKKTPGITNLWSYAGLKPGDNKKKGNKCNWNHTLKNICYLISDGFVKQRTPKYRNAYDKEKEKQLKNELPKGHADNRARRKAVKIFLKDLYLQWKKD